MDISNNQAQVTGVIMDEFTFNHEIYAEKFYTFTLSIPRLSGTDDSVRVMVSERLLSGEEFKIGDCVDIEGQFRSYNSYEQSGENRLVLTIFAKDIRKNTDEKKHTPNSLYLNGYICKNGQLKMTAEILYRFISGQEDFDEEHTGLADVLIEKEILAYCYRQHKKMRKKLWERA